MTAEVNKDDITAITSRMDAFAVVMIELMAQAHNMNSDAAVNYYTKRYDDLAKNFRKGMLR